MPKMEAEITVTLEAQIIEDAILQERKRCADWCDQVAFLEWEQGELAAQRALNKVRDNILAGDDVQWPN